jgi:hypothetical protein
VSSWTVSVVESVLQVWLLGGTGLLYLMVLVIREGALVEETGLLVFSDLVEETGLLCFSCLVVETGLLFFSNFVEETGQLSFSVLAIREVASEVVQVWLLVDTVQMSGTGSGGGGGRSYCHTACSVFQ